MNFLRKLLGFLLGILFLILIVGGGVLYYTQGSLFENMDHQGETAQQDEQAHQEQPKQNPPVNVLTQQQVAQIIAAFLNQYADDLNKSSKLINEANGLIMADPFFTTPPSVDGSGITPYENLLPSVADVYGYQSFPGYATFYKQNLRDIHRGIYKLAQGMTSLNQVLDKINGDVSMLQKDPYYLPPRAFQPVVPPVNVYPYYPPGYQGAMPQYNISTMPNQHVASGTTFDSTTIRNGLYLLVIILLFVIIFSIGGFLLSLFKKPQQPGEPQ